jgi:PA14 domain-containing protein
LPYLLSTRLLVALALLIGEKSVGAGDSFRESFSDGTLSRWRLRDGNWRIRDGKAIADGGFSMLVLGREPLHDVELTADVAYAHEAAHAAVGIAFRIADDSSGYAVGLREIEKGIHPEYGPWERPVIQQSTGTNIPVTATGGGFYGPKYSDFYTYHSYGTGAQPLPNADGGPEHLCTETLNRPAKGLADCLRELAGKQNGFVVWELMIGRDNCRYPWGHPDGPDEPAVPFHGVVYPDGHPWNVEEVRALLGDTAFAALLPAVFRVEYYDGAFKNKKKTSITPVIDFDLGDEPGYGSPDASAGIGKDDFSIRWTGRLVAPGSGTYVLHCVCDGFLKLWLDGTQVFAKEDKMRRSVEGKIELVAGQSYQIRVDYVHRDGESSNHIFWSGPRFEKQVLRLDANAAATKRGEFRP